MCLAAKIGALFSPCGHLVCCGECSERVDECTDVQEGDQESQDGVHVKNKRECIIMKLGHPLRSLPCT